MNNSFNNTEGTPYGNLPQINPLEYPTVKCKNCGCEIFAPGLLFSEVPGSLYGAAGETIQVPSKIFYCINCKHLSPQDQEIYDELKLKAAKKEENKTKSSIII